MVRRNAMTMKKPPAVMFTVQYGRRRADYVRRGLDAGEYDVYNIENQ